MSDRSRRPTARGVGVNDTGPRRAVLVTPPAGEPVAEPAAPATETTPVPIVGDPELAGQPAAAVLGGTAPAAHATTVETTLPMPVLGATEPTASAETTAPMPVLGATEPAPAAETTAPMPVLGAVESASATDLMASPPAGGAPPDAAADAASRMTAPDLTAPAVAAAPTEATAVVAAPPATGEAAAWEDPTEVSRSLAASGPDAGGDRDPEPPAIRDGDAPVRAPSEHVPPDDDTARSLAPGEPLRMISMKTGADRPRGEAARAPLHVQLRSIADAAGIREPRSDLGHLAPPHDPRRARARRLRGLLGWASVAVVLAGGISLAIWLVAGR